MRDGGTQFPGKEEIRPMTCMMLRRTELVDTARGPAGPGSTTRSHR